MPTQPEQTDRGLLNLLIRGNYRAALEVIYEHADEVIDELISPLDRHQEEQFVGLLRKVTRKLHDAANRIDARLADEKSET